MGLLIVIASTNIGAVEMVQIDSLLEYGGVDREAAVVCSLKSADARSLDLTRFQLRVKKRGKEFFL